MGNNQALQVGAVSLSAVIGGALAAASIPLPLIVFGILLVAAGALLSSSRWQQNPSPCQTMRNLPGPRPRKNPSDQVIPLVLLKNQARAGRIGITLELV